MSDSSDKIETNFFPEDMDSSNSSPMSSSTDRSNKEVMTDPWRPVALKPEKKPCHIATIEMCTLGLAYFFTCITFPFSLLIVLVRVDTYERLVVYRLGWLRGATSLGPGIVFVMPCVDEAYKVDMRVVTMNVPSQEILTKDACTITVDAVIYYKVEDAIQAVQTVEDYMNATMHLAATTLRAVLGAQVLAEILTEKESLARRFKEILDVSTHTWGMKIENVEIKDVSLPKQLQRAMASEAEATRDARARIITAEGEKRAAVNLKQAAEMIASNPNALKLRYLQTLNALAAEKCSIILFPVPMSM